MEGCVGQVDWVQITNLVCNTLSLIALAYIGARQTPAPRRSEGSGS